MFELIEGIAVLKVIFHLGDRTELADKDYGFATNESRPNFPFCFLGAALRQASSCAKVSLFLRSTEFCGLEIKIQG
jgi:hypothetical protein